MIAGIKNIWSYLLIDLLILLLCIAGVYNFSNKADFPFKVNSSDTHLIIEQLNFPVDSISSGDIILSVEGNELSSREEVEVYLDAKSMGDVIDVEILHQNNIGVVQIQLVNYYSVFYSIIAGVVGLVFILTGIFVLFKSGNKNVGRIFHWSMVATTMIILMTWGNFTNLGLVLGLLTRTGFHIGYAFVPALFLHFSFLFPFERKLSYKKILPFVYGISFVFAIVLSLIFSFYANEISIYWLRLYIKTYDLCSFFVVSTILYSIFIQYKNYNSTKLLSNRKKLRWILFGYFVGPMSYLFLWVIPNRIMNRGLIPEELVLLLMAFVPVTFAFAIMKYQLMDIDVIVRRTIVYPIAISILIIIYLASLTIIIELMGFPKTSILSVVLAVITALLFHPIKESVKKIVNKRIFKVEYDYRTALSSFLTEIKDIDEINSLTQKIINLINRLIPVNRAGYFSTDIPQKELSLLSHYNLEKFENKKLSFDPQTLTESFQMPITTKNAVEAETKIQIIELPLFDELGVKLIYEIKSGQNKLYGLLGLGEKKSGAKFTSEDIDLLNIITAKAGDIIEKIRLREELIYEKLEKEKLAELNLLKSYFVSSVSHDLKTPLTSIRMFAEIMNSSKNISEEKKSQYLEIIEGESNRLTRLIDNVLNYSKIEKGIKEYRFEKININNIIDDVLKSMEYQFKIANFDLVTSFHREDLNIFGDKDSVIEAIINLLSNSIKFSKEIKSIKISTNRINNYAEIRIKDQGIGISEEEIQDLFKPFFQSKKLNPEQTGGAGIGLTIVKNIMDAHNGKIEVESALGQGSTFILFFLLGEDGNETNINN